MTQSAGEEASGWRGLGNKGVTASFTSPSVERNENETPLKGNLHEP